MMAAGAARTIYLDHNATNPPDPRVLDAYRRALAEGWANPSSPHGPGRAARALVEGAREAVAAAAGVEPGRVTFTSSGTEALNQAIATALSAARATGASDAAPVVVASAVEHAAVLEPLRAHAAAGRARLVLAPVDADARVDADALARLVAPGVALVAVLAAQNEVGTVQPLEEVGRACRVAGVPLLVDASQAFGRLARDWTRSSWDYLVVSGHKLRAPRGAAALVHRRLAAEPAPLVLGGGQELGRRAGTEDVPAIAALGEACRLLLAGDLLDPAGLRARRDDLEAALVDRVPGVAVLAREAERLPQTTALLVDGVPSDVLVAGLDLCGVAASSGSACSSGALVASHVLAAMGLDERARGRLRLSFGPETTRAELLGAVDALAGVVARARAAVPAQG